MFGLRRHFLLDPSVTFLNNRKWGDARGAAMATAPFPEATDLARLKMCLYDKYRIEVLLIMLYGRKLIRVSAQGFDMRREVEKLVEVLREMIEF